MFKKIQLGLIISCFSISSYAYVIGTNFTIENNTATPMVMTVEQPNGQAENTIHIPAHDTSKVYLQNGDNRGLLYQTSAAPFKIKEEGASDKILVNGRVVYYVGASLVNKYSFLNSVTAAENLKVDTIYSCQNGGYGSTFENKLVINGSAD